MHLLWNSIIRRLLQLVHPKDIVEIGVDQGRNTENLLMLAQEIGATVHAVDPNPKFDVLTWQERHGSSFRFYQTLSLNALMQIPSIDAVLIDGDHNWYTVFNELSLIERRCRAEGKAFPLVLLHDIGWPYGRRDLYYDPENVPGSFRKPFQKKGLYPGDPNLRSNGGLNPHLFHAIYENDLQNGVLTAVEDFLKNTAEKLHFVQVPGLHGLGILFPANWLEEVPGFALAIEECRLTPPILAHLETLETQRMLAQIRLGDATASKTAVESQLTARETELLEVQNALQAANQEVEVLRHRIGSLEEQLLAATAANEQMQVRLRDLTDTEKRLLEAEHRERSARAEHQATQLELAQTLSMKASLEREVHSLRAQLQSAEAAASTQAAQLKETARQLEIAKRSLAEKGRELAQLMRWIDQLSAGTVAVLSSGRWRLGNTVGNLIRWILRRPKQDTAADYVARIMERYRNWRRGSSASSTQPQVTTHVGANVAGVQSPLPVASSTITTASQPATAPIANKISLDEDQGLRSEEYQRWIQSEEPVPAVSDDERVSARVIVLPSKAGTEGLRVTLQSIGESVPSTILSSASVEVHSPQRSTVVSFDNAEHLIARLNEAIAGMEETYLLLLPAGYRLAKGALDALAHKSKAMLPGDCAGIVIDEDEASVAGERLVPILKPGFSPDFLLEHDYIGYGVWLRRDALLSVGSFAPHFPTQFLRDALLRLWEKGYQFEKIDRVCCHRLQGLEERPAPEEQARLVMEAGRRRGCKVEVEALATGPRPVYDTHQAMASIIIPFKDRPELLHTCVESILRLTDYDRYELLLVDNNSTETQTKELLRGLSQDKRIRVLHYAGSFNWSKINNFASRQAQGEVLVFLNNDTKVLSSHWLRELVADAQVEGVGAVGAKLYYGDGSIQHAGVVIGLSGLAGHLFAGEDEAFLPQAWVHHRRNCSAVTGACMAVRRSLFVTSGGFDEEFIVTGSDVEFCLRLLKQGHRHIINPEVRLFHFEKSSRKDIPVQTVDVDRSLVHYEPYLSEGDPFYNRNWSRNHGDLRLRHTQERPVSEVVIARNQSSMKKSTAGLKLSDSEVVMYDVSPSTLEANRRLVERYLQSPVTHLKSVLWFIPHFEHIYWGGLYTIFRTADYFSRKAGAEQIFALYGNAPKKTQQQITEIIAGAFPGMRFRVYYIRPNEDPNQLPASDIAFCTLWTSAYLLVRYQKCLGKFYFVQDYEPLFYAAGSVAGLIEQTYRFGFVGIANTPGVANGYREINPNVHSFIPGVDRNLYYPTPDKPLSPLRIVFYARPDKHRNGFRLGVEALRLVKNKLGSQVDIVTVGGSFDPAEYGLEGVIRNLGVLPTIEAVADLYRTCHIGLVFMFTKHPSYQPIELMASGCAVVTNYNASNDWLLRDGFNALLTEPLVSCVADRVLTLAADADLRAKLTDNGLRTVADMTWERAMEQIYTAVTQPKRG